MAGGGRRQRRDARRHHARDAGPEDRQGAAGCAAPRGGREGGVRAVLHVRLDCREHDQEYGIEFDVKEGDGGGDSDMEEDEEPAANNIRQT